MNPIFRYAILLFLVAFASCKSSQKLSTDVLVIGGSASGTTAAIQSSRLGVSTLLLEETPWLGGMISAAGVAAFDGNHQIPSGLWNEFRDSIYQHYGGAEKVATGWVSNTLFEPYLANRILQSMTKRESNLSVMHGWRFNKITQKEGKVSGASFIHLQTGESLVVNARIVIDATELGDALAGAGIPTDIGLEPTAAKSENIAMDMAAKGIIQDLTYVAVLKDYGKDADCTIAKPRGYDPHEFDGACTDFFQDTSRKRPTVNAQTMLDYGKLPNGKYMINWPNYGNDFYFNPIQLSLKQRDSGYSAAKEQTLRFVYFIQHQLGFKNLGLADDEFPTSDRLALIPYHRESRRIRGRVRFDMATLAHPFDNGNTLYRTGVAIGDYPIDHHHKKNPQAPQQLEFYPVPSFSIPLGALLPKEDDNIIAAEKSISVSNIINGATRLQPCVMLIGQAAGTLAALAVKNNRKPSEVPVRAVQTALLEHNAALMPYVDATIHHPHFKSIQKIGATGILRGQGVPYKWANQTWFYPEQPVSVDTLKSDAANWLMLEAAHGPYLTIAEAKRIIQASASTLYKINIADAVFSASCQSAGMIASDDQKLITRGQLAVLIDTLLDPFSKNPIDYSGQIHPL